MKHYYSIIYTVTRKRLKTSVYSYLPAYGTRKIQVELFIGQYCADAVYDISTIASVHRKKRAVYVLQISRQSNYFKLNLPCSAQRITVKAKKSSNCATPSFVPGGQRSPVRFFPCILLHIDSNRIPKLNYEKFTV